MAEDQLKFNPNKSFFILLFGIFILIVTLSVKTPAYPAIIADLKFDPVYITWTNVFYSMSAAVLAPVMGRYGDVAGLKKALIVGFVAFSVGTLGLGLAPSLPVYLGSCFIQGAGFACVMPAIMAFIGRFFSVEKSARYFTIFGMCMTAGPIVGPLMSGLFLSVPFLGWRTMYCVFGGIIALVALFVIFIFPKIPIIQQTKAKFDVTGSVFIFISIGSFLLSPTLASLYGWTSPLVIGLLALFLLFGILFVMVENKKAHPLVDLKFIKSKDFSIPVVLYMAFNAFIQTFMFSLSYVVVLGMGQPAAITGTLIAVMYVAMTLFAPVIGKLMEIFNWRTVAFLPVALFVVACSLFAMTSTESPLWLVYVACVVAGMGNSCTSPLLMTTAMSGVIDESTRGSASGTFNMVGNLGGPIGVAIFIPILTSLAAGTNGSMNYTAAFSQVCVIMVVVAVLLSILAFVYPKHNPKAAVDAAKDTSETN